MARANLRLRIGPAALVALGLMLLPALWSASGNAGAVPATGTLAVSTTQPTVRTTVTTLPTTVTLPTTSAATTPVTVPVTTATTRPSRTVPAAPSSTATSTSTTTTTSTTIAPIPNASPAPVTLPLATEPQSATISPVFSVLSVVGFVVLIGLLIAQWYLTGPRRRGPTL